MSQQRSSGLEIVQLDFAILDRKCLANGKRRLKVAVLNLERGVEIDVVDAAGKIEGSDDLRDVLAKPLAGVNWPPRVREAFRNERLVFLGDLCSCSVEVLRRNRGIAETTVRNICDFLRSEQLWLGMSIPWWEAYRETLPQPPLVA